MCVNNPTGRKSTELNVIYKFSFAWDQYFCSLVRSS